MSRSARWITWSMLKLLEASVTTAAAEQIVQVAQAVQVDVEHRDVGAESHRRLGRVEAHGAGADDDHVAARHPGHAGQEDAAAAVRPAEVVGALLHGQAPGHLAHRREERQAPVGALDGLVADGDDAGLRQSSRREIRHRRQVQVGEDESGPRRSLGYSGGSGSFTFRIISASSPDGAPPSRARRRRRRIPRRGSRCRARRDSSIRTRCPCSPKACAPAGVSATRCSPVLISRGTPTIIGCLPACSPGAAARANRCDAALRGPAPRASRPRRGAGARSPRASAPARAVRARPRARGSLSARCTAAPPRRAGPGSRRSTRGCEGCAPARRSWDPERALADLEGAPVARLRLRGLARAGHRCRARSSGSPPGPDASGPSAVVPDDDARARRAARPPRTGPAAA